ncbi:tyrosine-type recombinase/integrase [Phyllobacterium bourgognense]|uniref:Uncharacterized protein DUF4102 n=1 Tax=Phyllobacterium bourgognense TaxID=314236 RepID=A0A368YR05_9HYPH|nr:Arm DNA-binding domain-containing protein [Phyllobacterium bourgognense]RCW82008.1 uncharacterized protein DUF4102 [Phyllobacterium bourgognense]
MSKKKFDTPLTAAMINSLSKPGRYPEGSISCLYVKVRSETSKIWIFMSKRTGEMSLGSWTGNGKAGMTSIPMARKKALAIHAQIGDGKDPRAEKRASLMTFGKAATATIASIKAGFKSKKTEEGWERILRIHAAPITDTPVNKITVEDMLAILKPIWTTNAETAKRLRQYSEKVLDWATVMGYRSGPNPALWKGNLDHLLPKRPRLQRGHHPAVPYADMPAFVARLKALDDVATLPLLLTILCATRTSETLLASGKRSIWTRPCGRFLLSAPRPARRTIAFP